MSTDIPIVESLVIAYNIMQILLWKCIGNPRWKKTHSFKFAYTGTTQHDYFPILFHCIQAYWTTFISSHPNLLVFCRANNQAPCNKHYFSSNARESESQNGISTSLNNHCLPSSKHVSNKVIANWTSSYCWALWGARVELLKCQESK